MIGFYNYTVILTYVSLCSAVYGITQVFEHNEAIAFLCLLLSGICDLFDGKVARHKTDRTEQEKVFGIQIDSLADLVCFGVLPAVIGYSYGFNYGLGLVSALLIVLCGLIRLGYFNVMEEERQRTSAENRKEYQGLPITTSAIVLPLSGHVPGWMRADVSIRPLAARYFLILYSTMLFRSARIIFGTILRSAGDTKTPMKIGLLVNLLNVIGNFFLIYPSREISVLGSIHIFGAGLGVEGAALASALSVAVGGILVTIALWRHKAVSPNGHSLKPDPEILRPCLRVSLPNMFQRFCTSLGYVVFAAMINSLGELSTAAHTIANTVESAFYIPGYGMMAAAATLTGNCIGAGDSQRQRDLARMILVIEITLMAVTGGLLLIFAPSMMRIFSRDAAVIVLGSTVLRMVAVSEPFYGVSIVTEGMLQGAGLTFRPFLFNVIGMWGVRIIGTAVCIRLGFGLVAAWSCMIAHNMLLLILLRIYYRKAFPSLK